MKKVLVGVAAIFVAFAAAVIILLTVDFNRMGKENVYVQIVSDGVIEDIKLDTGEVVKRYGYNLPAYAADGEEVMVEFSANKNLRQDAYLMLYVTEDNEVTSYDEVELADIPKAAKEKL